MTFEEQMRIIELKELNSDDQRKVFTRLVCVYFENKTGQNDEFSEGKCLMNGVSHPKTGQMDCNDNNTMDTHLKRSLSASNLSSSLNSSLHSGKMRVIVKRRWFLAVPFPSFISLVSGVKKVINTFHLKVRMVGAFCPPALTLTHINCPTPIQIPASSKF